MGTGLRCPSALESAGSEEARLPVSVVQRGDAHPSAHAAVGERSVAHINSHMDGRQGVEVTEEDEIARLEGGNAHRLARGP